MTLDDIANAYKALPTSEKIQLCDDLFESDQPDKALDLLAVCKHFLEMETESASYPNNLLAFKEVAIKLARHYHGVFQVPQPVTAWERLLKEPAI